MWTAFPSSDYYGGSAPSRAHQATVALPARLQVAARVGRARKGSHVHCVPVGGGGVQLCSGSIAASTPQAFLVASLPATSPGPGVAHHRWACTALRPKSARLEPVYLLRGFKRWFLTSTFPSR